MIEILKSHPFFEDKDISSCELLENQGYCNENYLVIVSDTKYIVRKLLRDDVDRELEWKVQRLAYDAGITAEPLVFDREQGFMVFAFLEGEHRDKLDKDDVRHLAKILKKLHTIKVNHEPINLEIKNQTKEAIKAFETIENYPKEYVLCHNDLNLRNIFFSNDIKLIDWEYAGVNDRYFDLACVCVEFALEDEMQDLFLKIYFQEKYFVLEKLEAYKVVYEALCKEWFDAIA